MTEGAGVIPSRSRRGCITACTIPLAGLLRGVYAQRAPAAVMQPLEPSPYTWRVLCFVRVAKRGPLIRPVQALAPQTDNTADELSGNLRLSDLVAGRCLDSEEIGGAIEHAPSMI